MRDRPTPHLNLSATTTRLPLKAAAVDQRDLSSLRWNRFEKLKGDRAGIYSIRSNDQWSITFRIEANRMLDVTIEDYHCRRQP